MIKNCTILFCIITETVLWMYQAMLIFLWISQSFFIILHNFSLVFITQNVLVTLYEIANFSFFCLQINKLLILIVWWNSCPPSEDNALRCFYNKSCVIFNLTERHIYVGFHIKFSLTCVVLYLPYIMFIWRLLKTL